MCEFKIFKALEASQLVKILLKFVKHIDMAFAVKLTRIAGIWYIFLIVPLVLIVPLRKISEKRDNSSFSIALSKTIPPE